MMATRPMFGLWCVMVALLPACGGLTTSQDPGGDDSSTHWLSRCDSDAECGELACLCGVCTEACTAAASCSALDDEATCSGAAACDDAPRVCTKECVRDQECASGHCIDGVCGSEAPAPSNDRDAGPEPQPEPEPEPVSTPASGNGGTPGAGGASAGGSGGASGSAGAGAPPMSGVGGSGVTGSAGMSSVDGSVLTPTELCESFDTTLGQTFEIDLRMALETREISTAAACVGDAGAPLCCNWVWRAYVLPCPAGDIVLTVEGTPFGSQTEPGGFDDFGPVEVSIGCQGMDCDPTCVPATASEIGRVLARLEPSEDGFATPFPELEPFYSIAALVIEQDLDRGDTPSVPDNPDSDPEPDSPPMTDPSCDVAACNDHGACVELDVWGLCECDAETLPPCELPLFREIGPSRSNDELLLVTISGDGSTIVGSHRPQGAPPPSVPVQWTLDGGLEILPQDLAGQTTAYGVSFDGSLVVGEVVPSDGSDPYEVAWRGGVLALRTDADVIEPRPFNTPTLEELYDLLDELGIDTASWQILNVNHSSDDNRVIFGLGILPDRGARWLLRLP